MDEEEGGGPRLSKRFSDKDGEVDFKTKAGTAWSHSFLNQKPWHPLSYPNQRRKWIAEQTHAQHERRAEEVAREYAQEQEFFRQTALVSKKEKEKMEMMKAVSFMYIRPPGYNAESAKAAEVADERKQQEPDNPLQNPSADGASTSMAEKKKPRPKDVFGRNLPTEEQFEVLKNAPRLETGVAGRAKPFAVELRNVKCVRCGNFGHQSGDRECPLKDIIMPNEESRLKRDDPLTAILAHTDPSEPLKWELKQKPGMSPPRGGFKPDDPNQQIVAEDIFDEYGGFLGEEIIPELLSNFSNKPKKKSVTRSKRKRQSSPSNAKSRSREHDWSSDEGGTRSKKKKHKKKKNKRKHCESSSSDDSEVHRHHKGSSYSSSSEDSDSKRQHRSTRYHDDSDSERHHRSKHYHHEDSDPKRQHGSKRHHEDSDSKRQNRSKHHNENSDFERHHGSKHHHEDSEAERQHRSKHYHEDSDSKRQRRSKRHDIDSDSNRQHRSKHHREDSDTERQHRSKHHHEDSDAEREHRSTHQHIDTDSKRQHRSKHNREDSDVERQHRSKQYHEDSDSNQQNRSKHYHEDSDSKRQHRSTQFHEDSDSKRQHRSKHYNKHHR